ncbi:hypothetical protein [Actinoplanes sp. ATCC 53533]|uniref:hypothetical protein n=1 Tax=Actinoplanes sp. ATCC 53533 TaxID=1288362 RepID=UPI000F769A90|nr:hypothetical protein [Actinoplanes sp. ATCC 53533]
MAFVSPADAARPGQRAASRSGLPLPNTAISVSMKKPFTSPLWLVKGYFLLVRPKGLEPLTF